MPLYNFTLGHLTGQLSFRRLGYEAANLDGAIREGIAWAKKTRRLEGNVSDLSLWPLVILAGNDTQDHACGTKLFEMQDVRPD